MTRQKFQNYLYQALSLIQRTLWKPETYFTSVELTSLSLQHLSNMCSIVQLMMKPGGCSLVFTKTAFLLVEHMSNMLTSIDCVMADGTRNQLIQSMIMIKDIAAGSDRVAERVRAKLLSDTIVVKQVNISLLDSLSISEEESNHLDAMTTSPMLLNDRREEGTELLERPPKRQKRTQVVKTDLKGEVGSHDTTLNALCQALDHTDVEDLSTIASRVSEILKQGCDEGHVIKLLLLSARLPCAGAKTLSDTDAEARCDLCAKSTSRSHWKHQHWKWFFEIISAFLESSGLQGSKEARVMMLVAIRRFANHTPITEHLDLTTSALGRSCLQGVRSSCREVRIAAVNALPRFLKSSTGTNDVICRQDRVIALNLLQQMLDGNDAQLWESSVTALGSVAASCEDDEMNIVLLRLVECLGSTNTLLCSLARLELRNVAIVKSVSLDELFRPFWRTIAVSAIKDLQNRPQKVQQLADILGKSVDDLLVETQEETLPFLLLWKHTDTLQRIANARGPGGSIRDLCMQSRNLTVILANLLIQDPTQPETIVRGLLGRASPELQKVSVSDLLKMDVAAIACELLKIASDAEGPAQKKVSPYHLIPTLPHIGM